VSDIDRPVIACLGLSFKANIDDVRESPALEIVRRVAVLQPEAEILVAAPHKDRLPQELAALPNVRLVQTDAAIEAAQVVVLLVDHDKFREIEPASLEGKRLIDTRGFWR
ncbi:MAG TPA: UDP binding domain-containing protein, partial [Arthrobacter sp.]